MSWISVTEEFKELLAENGLELPEKIQGNDNLFKTIEENKELLSFLISYFKKTINNEI
jgi:hypothetical protein